MLMCRSILVQARTDASLVRETGDGRLMQVPACFATPAVVVNNGQEYDINSLQANLDHKVEQWNKRGSNFNIERVSMSIHPYRPLHGSTPCTPCSHAGLFGEQTLFNKRPKQ